MMWETRSPGAVALSQTGPGQERLKVELVGVELPVVRVAPEDLREPVEIGGDDLSHAVAPVLLSRQTCPPPAHTRFEAPATGPPLLLKPPLCRAFRRSRRPDSNRGPLHYE
jgi:hypothetical protein